jgi:energy-converting hydrogenase Eha subunit E
MLLGLGFLVLVVGVGLIYLLYGQGAALFGLICLAGAAVPILAVVALLAVMDKASSR